MFKKVLICIDLSPAAESLVRCVGEIKKLGLEEIVLAHVIYVTKTPGLEVMLENKALPFLERHKTSLEEHGFRVTIEMPFGLPANTLAEIAEKQDVSLIVIGSHGHSIVVEAVLGSVSTKLLHLTRRPILFVNLGIHVGAQCGADSSSLFANILFPTDFSETAERVIPYLGKIGIETKCPVTLFHVIAEKEGHPLKKKQREKEELSLLEAKRQLLEREGVSGIAVDLAWGDPALEICTKVTEGKFSCVVMGSLGKGGLKELFIGSVAKKVVRHAGVPVLLIPSNF